MVFKIKEILLKTSERKCIRCNIVKSLTEFNKRINNTSGYCSHCKSCNKLEYKVFRVNNIEKVLLSTTRRRAKSKNIKFNLSIEDIIIPKLCPVLEIPIVIGEDKYYDNSPSIDRIDPKEGYTKENIAIISHRANTIKNAATVVEIDKIRNWMVNIYKEQIKVLEKDLKIWPEVVMIPVDKLDFSKWNVNTMDDETFAALCYEIKMNSFDEPVQVIRIKDSDRYLVLGGEHRVKAGLAAKMKEIPCVLKKKLENKDEKELALWTVRRNHIRGKIDAQKYAVLEQKLSERWSMASEAARREMLIKGDILKMLKKSPALEDNESLELADDDELLNDAGPSTGSKNESTDKKSSGNRSATDGDHEVKKKFADRRALLMALKTAEQDVLLESGDTVEHGYLFFAQSAGLHLVVNESAKLHELVSEMVNILKRNSERVDEFLSTAISKELELWR